MPVEQCYAYPLLRSFGLLEFTLKRTGLFFQKKSKGYPPQEFFVVDVDWNKVDASVARLGDAFVLLVPRAAKDKLLAPPRRRPKKEQIELNAIGDPRAEFRESDLPPNDAEALVVAMRRVRNNLFHGGKEDPLGETYVGEDNDWAQAATAVAQVLLDLLDRHQLRP